LSSFEPHDHALNVQRFQLRHIPTVGASSLPLLSYIGGGKYFDHGLEILQEGYERVGHRILNFKR
jgi:hypothetical protein